MRYKRFEQPKIAIDDVEMMQNLGRPVAHFIKTNYDFTDNNDSVPCENVWEKWKDWCENVGYKVGSKDSFYKKLRAAFPKVQRSRNPYRFDKDRTWVYTGIREKEWNSENVTNR